MKFPLHIERSIRQRGKFVADINPGSKEVAVPLDLALEIIEFCQGQGVAVLGGDVLLDKDGRLVYTTDSWHCDREPEEGESIYLNRSLLVARRYISLFAGDEHARFVLVLND